MTKNSGGALALLLLAACNASPDNGALSDAESRRAGEAAINGRIDCALEGAKRFDRDCTIDEMRGADDTILVVGRADKGYRRLQVATDGRGVVRSEEHTSELQSLMRTSYAVFCLKKKKINKQ